MQNLIIIIRTYKLTREIMNFGAITNLRLSKTYSQLTSIELRLTYECCQMVDSRW